MNEKITNFKELRIWQKGIEIVKDAYQATSHFPRQEDYSLTSQIRRSAISIPANIAEGFKRYHNKEYKQFLHIALGSAAELETHLIISNELNYISQEQLNVLCGKLDQLSKMTMALMKKLT